MNKLTLTKSCPFCGGSPKIETDQVQADAWLMWVACMACSATSITVESSSSYQDLAEAEREVIKAWERRVE
jgi:Lar family restriction alleviation protein